MRSSEGGRFRPRAARLEACEPRLLLSAAPVYDFRLDEAYLSGSGQYADPAPALADAHALTGLDQVRADYGFAGAGQTVAVIDTGIAYSHYALGGGYGPGYRVVGGWDFTTNTADPFDTGPFGSHGTHVAGIIGSDDAVHTGVAPEVDLVALRVFDDQGGGYFSWVEQALWWVHENRLAFEHPITTVNLSLGSAYNSASVPSWAMLENALAQLEADGVFVAVAAGNGFTRFNAPGLSYPAASPHVVPVGSVDGNGALSSFSQRHPRMIAAPGRSVMSTVPDYMGNYNGIHDDFARYSGTSMAAPYVAGASVLLREAYAYAGIENVNQAALYDLMYSTADTFFDAATEQYYRRLNLQTAFDAIMPPAGDNPGSVPDGGLRDGGNGSDRPIPGFSQIGVHRGGTFYLGTNGGGPWNTAAPQNFRFGNPGDTPLAGDWNGDGTDQIGVWRNGVFYLDFNGDGRWDPAVDQAFRFGNRGDTPIAGDWNGDGRDQIGVHRGGVFYLDMDGDGRWNTTVDKSFRFGNPTDTPLAGDWNGDGCDQIGVWRGGVFYLDADGDGRWDPAADLRFQFGSAGDTPLVGNWSAASAPSGWGPAPGAPPNAGQSAREAIDPSVAAAISYWAPSPHAPTAAPGWTAGTTVAFGGAAGTGRFAGTTALAEAVFPGGGVGQFEAAPAIRAEERLGVLADVMHELGRARDDDQPDAPLAAGLRLDIAGEFDFSECRLPDAPGYPADEVDPPIQTIDAVFARFRTRKM